MLKKTLLALAAMLGLGISIYAQESGQISGVLHDQSGAVVPGAKVTATEAGTGLSRTATSATDGSYLLPNLRPTTYILSTEASGFRAYRQADVQLLANQSLTINIAMDVGSVTETVNVSGNVVQVDTTSSTLAEVVEQARIEILVEKALN